MMYDMDYSVSKYFYKSVGVTAQDVTVYSWKNSQTHRNCVELTN